MGQWDGRASPEADLYVHENLACDKSGIINHGKKMNYFISGEINLNLFHY